MTAVAMPSAQENGTVTSVDSTWTDCASIAAGSFTASRKYLIVANAIIQCGGGANEHHIRLVHGTTPTEFTDAHGIYDPGLSGANGRGAWQYMTVFTQPGTAELVKIQIMREASTANVTSGYTQILCVDITDLVENTDYWFNEDTADYETTTTPVAKAAVTLTPNGTDDFAVWANAVYDGGGTLADDGNDFEAEMFESVASSVLPRWQNENEDADAGDENHSMVLQRSWAAPSAASRTWSIRLSHNGASAFTVLSSRVFVLRLNAFDQHAIVYTEASDSPTVGSFEIEATVSVTPNVTGNWLYIGTGTNVAPDDASGLQIRLQDDNDGSMGSDPAYGDDEIAVGEAAHWDLSDEVPLVLGNVKSLTSGALRTINLDFKNGTFGTGTVAYRSLIAFSAELAGAGFDPATGYASQQPPTNLPIWRRVAAIAY